MQIRVIRSYCGFSGTGRATLTHNALYTRHVNNTPPIRNRLQFRPQTIKAPCQINRHDLLPLLIFRLGNRPNAMMLAYDTRAIRRAVQPAVFVHYGLYPRVYFKPFGDVDARGHVRYVGGEGGEVRAGGGECVGVDVGDADYCAPGREDFGG